MRICYLGDGESIHVIRWCKYFASMGNEIHLVTFKKTTIENITTHFVDAGNIDVKGGNWKVLLSARKVKKLIQEIKPDILHAHYATSYGSVGALCNYRPFIVTAHGSDVLISPENSFFYRRILKYVFNKADWITSMSDPMREKMLQLGANPSKTETLIFGIDTSVFNSKERRSDNNKFIITSTRNFEAVYNIQHLLESVALVNGKIPNLSLNLIGSGTLRSELQDLAEKKNLLNIVTFWGKISQDELVKILQTSHVFVSVSLSDGNNISLNEAMACGDLCIATDIPANRQWIKDTENGFLVPVNNVEYLADKILTSYKYYNELSAKFTPLNEKIIYEKADWKENMKKVEKKYKELTSGKLKTVYK